MHSWAMSCFVEAGENGRRGEGGVSLSCVLAEDGRRAEVGLAGVETK